MQHCGCLVLWAQSWMITTYGCCMRPSYRLLGVLYVITPDFQHFMSSSCHELSSGLLYTCSLLSPMQSPSVLHQIDEIILQITIALHPLAT